jgi:hypothetical protein
MLVVVSINKLIPSLNPRASFRNAGPEIHAAITTTIADGLFICIFLIAHLCTSGCVSMTGSKRYWLKDLNSRSLDAC